LNGLKSGKDRASTMGLVARVCFWCTLRVSTPRIERISTARWAAYRRIAWFRFREPTLRATSSSRDLGRYSSAPSCGHYCGLWLDEASLYPSNPVRGDPSWSES